ncbi:MAG: hypothetical protein ACE15D_09810 [Candidatus Eisenbacteria bacterium]
MRFLAIFCVSLCLLLALLPLTSCNDKTTKPPDDEGPYLSDTSIPNVLVNLRTAIVARDSTGYADRLAPGFEFVFDPNDVGGDDNIPPSWGRDDDVAAIGSMFRGKPNHDGYLADSVRLSFQAGEPVPSDDVAQGSMKVLLTAFYIAVDARKATSGEQLRYLVEGEQADLYLLQIGGEWRILKWVDRPIRSKAPATESTTWGQIKACWR